MEVEVDRAAGRSEHQGRTYYFCGEACQRQFDDGAGFDPQREWEVLCLLQQGRTTNEIGERLFVSSATVRSHVSAIVRKTQTPDRDAALAAVFAG